MINFKSGNTLSKHAYSFLCAFLSDIDVCRTAGQGGGEPSPQQISEYEASPEVARVKLLIQLAKSGQHDLAEVLLKRYPLTGKFGQNPAAFH